MAVFYDSNSQKYVLEGKPWKKGGEALIFRIVGNSKYVAKIYHQNRLTDREAKLKVMIASSKGSDVASYTAWPIAILYDDAGNFAGYTMPAVQDSRELRVICAKASHSDIEWIKYIKYAKNLAAAINNIHSIGHCVGDLNSKNILVGGNNYVTLIDTDSFHIHDKETNIYYPCVVGMPLYIPRELQGKNFKSLPPNNSFTEASDNFALAVLIFQLLVNGAHPFTCEMKGKYESGSEFNPEVNITHGRTPYFPDTCRGYNIGIPYYGYNLISYLPENIHSLFKRAFCDGHTNPNKRPSAEEWYHALGKLQNELKECERKEGHKYYKYANKCPWCEIEKRKKELIRKEKTSTTTTVVYGKQSPTPTPKPHKPPKPPKPPKTKFQKKLELVLIIVSAYIVLVALSALIINTLW